MPKVVSSQRINVDSVVLPASTFNKVLVYLASRPYREVEPIISEMETCLHLERERRRQAMAKADEQPAEETAGLPEAEDGHPEG